MFTFRDEKMHQRNIIIAGTWKIMCVLSAVFLFGVTGGHGQTIHTQKKDVQYIYNGNLTPGYVGAIRTLQAPHGTPVDETYFQPVKLMGAGGIQIAPAAEGRFLPFMKAPQIFGLNIGKVYRFRVTGIHLKPGVEVFPTVELIDRTHPPLGEEAKYPILIELTHEDLKLASEGKFVTRVIYVEDPDFALPITETEESGQGYYEISSSSDPLAVADILGRPVAILRIGGRGPDMITEPGMEFLYHCPPFLHYTFPEQEKNQ
ncbi:MAG: hypothetical protein Q4C96_04825 [Planctomycetia bacterium]|nr:hypothetical protein [Planctomycetia bacterium]